MLLFIVRHGDPIYNPDSLTPKGHLQAKALAKRFAMHGLDKIYASPLKRAQQTATPTSEILGLPIETLDWTSEALAANSFFIKKDGAQGCVDIFSQGGYTIAESDDTSEVFGTPKVALEFGGVSKVLCLDKISSEILNFFE